VKGDERIFASFDRTDLTYIILESLKGCRALPSPSKYATNVEIGMVSPDQPFRGTFLAGLNIFKFAISRCRT
jgi:hypothetical protein